MYVHEMHLRHGRPEGTGQGVVAQAVQSQGSVRFQPMLAASVSVQVTINRPNDTRVAFLVDEGTEASAWERIEAIAPYLTDATWRAEPLPEGRDRPVLGD